MPFSVKIEPSPIELAVSSLDTNNPSDGTSLERQNFTSETVNNTNPKTGILSKKNIGKNAMTSPSIHSNALYKKLTFREDLNKEYQPTAQHQTQNSSDGELGDIDSELQIKQKVSALNFLGSQNDITGETLSNTRTNEKNAPEKIKLSPEEALDFAELVIAQLKEEQEVLDLIKKLKETKGTQYLDQAVNSLKEQLVEKITRKMIIGFTQKATSETLPQTSQQADRSEVITKLVARHKPNLIQDVEKANQKKERILTPQEREWYLAMAEGQDDLSFFSI